MDSSAMMLWGVVFSGLGLGYFSYGKKQKSLVPLCCGLSLIIYPYFMTSLSSLLIVGITLVITPYFIKL